MLGTEFVLILGGVIFAAGAPTPHKGESKFEHLLLSTLDFDVDPCEDIYAFTCNKVAPPNGARGNDTFNWLDVDIGNNLIRLLEKVSNDSSPNLSQAAKKASTFFLGCLQYSGPLVFPRYNEMKKSVVNAMVRTKPLDYKEYSREKLAACLSEVTEGMGYAVDYVYNIYGNLSPDLTKSQELMERIKAAFIENVKTNQWGGATFKNNVIKGLKSMKFYNGFPTWIKNTMELDGYYSRLRITGNFVNDSNEVDAFRRSKQPLPSVADWPMLPASTMVNAAYLPQLNAFHLPSAIQAAPFFDPSRPAFFNFATLGHVIGHEMTHSVDRPDVETIWTPDARVEYKKRSECFINLYRKFKAAPTPIDPVATLEENIADNGALHHVHVAYQNWLKEKTDSLVSGYTPDHLLFLSYSYIWCNSNPNFYSRGLHSPSRARVNMPLSNFDRFRNTFQCKSNEPMVEKAKCSIW